MAELTPEGAALVELLDGYVWRGRRHGVVRGAALAALPGAALAALGLGFAGATVIGTGALLGGSLAPGRAVWARRLDAWGGLADACACALDHATRDTPVHRAQARRALHDAAGCPRERVAARPSLFWALPGVGFALALAFAPGARPSAGARGDAPSPPVDDAPPPAGRAAPPETAARTPEAPPTGAHGLASTAPPTADEAAGSPPEPGAPGSRTDPPEGSEGKAAGVGARAGELAGGRLRPVDAAAIGSAGARVLPAARGAGELSVETGVGAPLGGLPTARDDAFSDPARALPTADAPLVAAYFDRRGAATRRAPAPPSGAPRPPPPNGSDP